MRVRSRKQLGRSRDHCQDDEGNHERKDDGNVKDQQAADESTYEHRQHCNQAAAGFRSTAACETAVCRHANDGQGEDGRRQIGHRER